jgi:hypothetical protein
MILSFLLWCLWKERNNLCFEDHEKTLVDLKALFFKTLYHWIAVFDINILSFHTFLLSLLLLRFFFFFFFFFLLVKFLSCIHLAYLGCAFPLFNEFLIAYKKIVLLQSCSFLV